MRYLVTNQLELYNSPNYQICTVEQSLQVLEGLNVIGLDTETNSLSCHLGELKLVQMGNVEIQIAIDPSTVNIQLYKNLLESDKLFILHNAKFDLQFFLKIGIVIKQVFDTFLAERLLYLGYPKGLRGLSLQACCMNYFNIYLDKSVRGEIYKGLTDRVVVYGCGDVEYLIPLYYKQLEELEKKQILTAIEVENKFVIVLAYIEFCGVALDKEKWNEILQKNIQELIPIEQSLNTWVVNYGNSKYITKNTQGDLFEGFDTEPKCAIDWNSPKQVTPLFEELGLNCAVFDKETKRFKKSIDAKVIKPQKDISPLIPIYLKFSELSKLISTYGEKVLWQINPNTDRIHANFTQLMSTGRLSSGKAEYEDSTTKSKAKSREELLAQPEINLQNIPHGADYRSCFIAEPGNKWLSVDFDGQESVILTNVSKDPAMIKFFQEGKGDIHSLVAKMVYPEEIKECPLENIKEQFSALRNEAKKVEFAINYSGNANTISTNNCIPIEEAQIVYDNYMKGFPGIKKYQDKTKKEVMQKGYILISSVIGTKSFVYDFEELKTIAERFNPEFWAIYRTLKKEDPTNPIVTQVQTYFRRKTTIEKHAVNYPIQGTGALMAKIAAIKFYNYIVSKNLLFKIKIVIPVHDELNVECPDEYVEETSKVLVNCMKSAGDIFCPIIPCTASLSVGEHWIH